MRIDLDKVPTRQDNMHSFEILLSESQERMLIVGKKGMEQSLYDIFDKWDLECRQIGEVTDTGYLEFYRGGEKIAHVPAESLVLGGGAPVYDREIKEPGYVNKIAAFNINNIQVPADLKKVARQLVSMPTIASKRWIYEQYDSMVRTNSANTNNPSDAHVVRIKGNEKSLVVTVDCNSSYVYADPYRGAMIAVAEAARNIACTGGKGVAITNCLNFGNPYNPEVYWQFANAIKGMGEACRRFDTPVTGGNVSFYNQTVQKGGNEPVYPTPTIGMLGILDNIEMKTAMSFESPGDIIVLLGDSRDDIGQSQYLRQYHGQEHSPAPYFDLEEEVILHDAVREIIRAGICRSAHDVSEGGLFTNLLESGLKNSLGFTLDVDPIFRPDAYLFGESQGRIVISVKASDIERLKEILGEKINYKSIGIVTDNVIRVADEEWGTISEWKDLYENSISKYFEN